MTLTLQNLMPAVITSNTQVIVADIDGDGNNEVIMLDSNLPQLSIIHQFKYSDITLNMISPTIWPASNSSNTTPIWTSDSNTHWWTIWSAQGGKIPGQGSNYWGMNFGDTIIAADFDGDGTDELFIYNVTFGWWGILKWQTATNQLQVLCQVQPTSSTPFTPGSNINWQIWATDKYFIIPNLQSLFSTAPANSVGILAYNTQTQAWGVMQYSASKTQFLQLTLSSSGSFPGWTLRSPDMFYPANFTNPTTSTVTVYNSSDEYMALLTWSGSEFTTPSAQYHNAGDWSFGAGDQVQCADLDGDGMAELFMYQPNTSCIGVLKWVKGQIQSLAVTCLQIDTAPNAWVIGKNDNYFCVDNPAGGPALIYAFSEGGQGVPAKVGLLQYGSKAFTCKWTGTSLAPNNGWPVKATDSFYAGRQLSSSSATLFTVSNQSSSTVPAASLGAANWNGQAVQNVSSAKLPVLGWSPAFLASAPATKFTKFEGVQKDIYEYISKLFPVPGQPNPSPTSDLRSQYSNLDNKGFWMSFVTAINGLPSPKPSWLSTDWNPVLNTIIAECTQVTAVYNMYEALASTSQALERFKKTDLKTVKENISKLGQSNASSAEYWLGQVFVMATWGLAASAGLFIPGEMTGATTTFGIFFSMVASMAGSGVGYDPTQSKSYAVADMEEELDQVFDASLVAQASNRSACLTDPVKLQLVFALIGNQWAILSSLPTTLPVFSARDRFLMYEQLMPVYFSIMYGPFNLPPPFIEPPVIFAPGGVTKYGLKGSHSLTASEFTGSDLYGDLFTTLGATQPVFFEGIGPWAAIPRLFQG